MAACVDVGVPLRDNERLGVRVRDTGAGIAVELGDRDPVADALGGGTGDTAWLSEAVPDPDGDPLGLRVGTLDELPDAVPDPVGEACIESDMLDVADEDCEPVELPDEVPDALGEKTCEGVCEGDALSERDWLAVADCDSSCDWFKPGRAITHALSGHWVTHLT